jgi:hypothetical protein
LVLVGGAAAQPAFARNSYSSTAVSLALSSGTVAPGGNLTVTATVTGTTYHWVAWFVDGVFKGNSTVGTIPSINNTATYTAPSTPGTHTIKAVSDYNNTKSASATVKVVAPAPSVSVSLAPGSASLNPGGTASFTATVSGSTNTAVAWTVDGVAGGSSTVGTVSGTGASVTYTAPASAGSHTLVATSAADSTQSASAAISVLASAVTVSTSPASATLNPGGTVAISATVGGTSSTAVTWTVDGVAGGSSTVGTITGSGATVTYTAPGTAGSHTVTATSAANGASSASTVVSVQASSGSTVVALTNSTTYAGINGTVNGGGTVLMTATVTGLANTTVTWTVDGVAKGNSTVGTVNSGVAMGSANNWGNTALYLAPATPGTHSITATASDGTVSSPLAITVGTPYSVANSTVHTVPAPTGVAATDTANILAAMSAGIVQFQAGTYNVACGSDEYVFQVPSNVTFQFPAGCAIHASKAPSGGGIFLVNGASNVNFIGAGPTSIIDGGYPSNGGNAADIMIWSGSNITIAGLTLENAPLDGITVEGCYATTNAKSILVYGCTINTNGRNGMSPCGVDYLVVRDSTLSHNLHNPAAGIDFECNSNQRATYCSVFNDVMNNNSDGTYGGLIQSGPDNSGSTGIMSNMVYAFLTGSANCGFGIEAQNCSDVQILNNAISGTTNGEYGGVGIDIVGSRSSTSLLILGNTITSCAGDAIQVGCSGATGDYVEYNTYTGCGSGIVASSGVTVAQNAQ